MTPARSAPRQVLVVGWFPAADDMTAGRFVADQVAALRATGTVEPSVVSFEKAAIRGPGPLRERQAAAVAANGLAALRALSPFAARGAGGPAAIPVARLAAAAGETPSAGPDHRAIHDEAALLPLLDRLDRPAWDLVHAHVGYPEGAAAAAAAARLGVPLVLTEHASFLRSLLAEPLVRQRYRTTALAAARVIAVSRMLAGELTGLVPELAGRIVVIPNTVVVEDFEIGHPGDRVPGELLWVGGRSETKGIATLLRAFALVHERRPETTLRLVGRPPRPEQDAGWKRLAAELRVEVAVRFEPSTDRAGVSAAMGRADLFVHPSPRETFGVVAVEALASGLPVVATDSGGVSEVLGANPEALGAIVRAEDPAALSAAIVDALDRRASFDPAVLRAHAVERFGAAQVARQIVALYDEVLAEGSRKNLGSVAPRQASRHPSPGGGPAGASRPTVIVGFSRLELDRALARFPSWVLADAILITSGGPLRGWANVRLAPAGSDRRLAELLDWGAASGGRAGRAGRRLRRALRTLAARGGVAGDAGDRLLADLARTLSAVLPHEPGPAIPLLVCLGGIDHLVAAPFIASGRAIAAPGGLRWLADLRVTAQEATPPRGSRDA